MTNDEKIRAVTASLTGEFYVGQRVSCTNGHPPPAGTVMYVGESDYAGEPLIGVVWDHSGESYNYLPAELYSIE